MSLRQEFVHLASQDTLTMTELCQRFNISRQTGYKWLERYQQEGESGLEERSRAPLHHPQAMLPRSQNSPRYQRRTYRKFIVEQNAK